MDTSVLEGLGLTKNEIDVFIKLLELGESKAGKIISETGLQSSAVYNAINSLIKKGFVSYLKKSHVKYYGAAEPETILDYIESKKREYAKIIPQLKEKQNKKDDEGVEFFKTAKGIKLMIFELLKDAKKGEIYRYFSPETKYYDLSVEKVYSAEKHIRKTKKIITKAIYPEDARKITKKTKTTRKRYIKSGLPPNTLMFQNKVAIISWKGEFSGILIRSKDIYNSYVNFFEDLWKIAKG